VLAGIWRDVLSVDRVGITDNFFDLGGHSLLATQLLTKVRQTFRVELRVPELFEAQTVAELARRLTASERTEGQVERIAALRRRVQGMSPDEVAGAVERRRLERQMPRGPA